MKFDILEHESVPEHKILTEEEVEEIFKNLDYDKYQLPRFHEVARLTGHREMMAKIVRKQKTYNTVDDDDDGDDNVTMIRLRGEGENER